METQKTISDWATNMFGYPTVRKSLQRMFEEIKELEQLIEYEHEEGSVCCTEAYLENSHTKIADEIADIMICAYQAMNTLGFDLHACVNHKMEINRHRKWKLAGDGTGQHVQE